MAHKCDRCDYTTNKKFNLDRHINAIHTDDEELSTNNDNKCTSCYKVFTSSCYLRRHQRFGRCKQRDSCLTCEICKEKQVSRYALSRHRKTCASQLALTAGTSSGQTNIADTMNIGVQNNIQTQNNNNTTNILVFPMTDDENAKFDFVTDHINLAKLQEFIKQRRPAIGFNKFVSEVLENPQNRNVQKKNMKDKYSKIHVGNDKWELALDADVYPTMTHHMTTAALGKMEEHRAAIPRSIRDKASEFVRFIDHINTNDEGDVYNEAVERIKIILVNLCNLL